MGDVLDLLYNFINDKPAPNAKHLSRMAISRIEQQQQRVAELEQERDALAANNKRLIDIALNEILKWVGDSESDELLVRRIWDSVRIAMLKQSPQQSLAERDAEVARHFLYGYGFCRANGFLFDEQLQAAAEQYAAKIRNGEGGE